MLKRTSLITALCTTSCFAMNPDLARIITACQIQKLEQFSSHTLTSHLKEITSQLESSSCSEAILEALEKKCGTKQVSQSLTDVPWHSNNPGIRDWGLKVHRNGMDRLKEGQSKKLILP